MSSPHRAPDPHPGSSQRASTWAGVKAVIDDRRWSVLTLAILSVMSGFAEAALLALIAEAAVMLARGASHAHLHLGPLHLKTFVEAVLLAAFAMAVARLVLQVPLSVLPGRIVADVQKQLRTRLFHAFSRGSWEVQARDREGQLQEVMTNQVIQATGSVLGTIGLLISAINVIVLLVFAVALNPFAAAIVFIICALLFGMLQPLRGFGRRQARSLSRAQVEYSRVLAESIRLAEETQVFGAGAAQRARISPYVASARDNLFVTQMMFKLISNLYQGLIYVLFVAALFGLYQVGSAHAASLGAVVLILVRASSSGQSVQSSYQGLVQSLPFVERTEEAERRYRESAVVEGSRPLEHVRSLAFESVGYAYRAGRPVLSDVSFEVDRAEVVGVIGPSGAGKSTLVQLLLGLREPGEGRYLVNGVSAREFLPADWHRLVAYVPQEPHLLHASVADNIRYFRDLDDEAVERAARLARIHDDVIGWAEGYQTIVGPRADAVSGGQQQRICLARALAARPEMLVLDEPTSALDPKSEMLIQQSLTELEHELTLFIVAHRMSTLDICDRVMIIIDGKLVAFDTITNLQAHNRYYRSASRLAAGAVDGALR